jgi:hypothetical protein
MRFHAIAAVAAALTVQAAAQDPAALEKLHAEEKAQIRVLAQEGASPEHVRAELERMAVNAKMLTVQGGIMGPLVKGAPFSGDEVSEVTQVLADGTRIHRENRTTVYRDGEGRMRRETPDSVSIWDPVAGVSYFLDPKNQSATKMPLAAPAGNAFFSSDGKQVRVLMLQGALAADDAKAREPLLKAQIAGMQSLHIESAGKPAPKTESLGGRTLEGIAAQGTRETVTIEAGAIGNDRPIQIVSERWYSPELQRTIMTRRSDPRSGEETSRLTNIRRGEPGADLFQVPVGYRVVERK